MTTRVARSFSKNKYSDESLIIFAQKIHSEMLDNPNFPTPNPTLAVLLAAITAFSDAVVKSKNGTKEDTAFKNSKRKDLEDILRPLSNYVQDTSKGDEVIILSSGFDTVKTPAPVGPLPVVTGIEVNAGTSHGSLNLKWNVIPNTYIYAIEFTEAPVSETSIRQRVTSSRSNVVIPNLKRGQQYAFYVAAVGTDPTLNWSDEVMSYVM